MNIDDPLSSLGLQEDDDTFTRRRVEEERRKTAETSCMVRSVHEDLLESYEDRAAAAIAASATLEGLLDQIDATSTNVDRSRTSNALQFL
jgi:Rad3-related DNA helicase